MKPLLKLFYSSLLAQIWLNKCKVYIDSLYVRGGLQYFFHLRFKI
jgi:hypothetical protein